MAKTIKVIDLLNKIANGEEVPEKIKCRNFEYIYSKEICWYRRIDDIGSYDEWFISADRLNETIKIIEEQQDIDVQNLEETGIMLGWALLTQDDKVDEQKESINFTLDLFGNKLNEIAKNLNKMANAVKKLDKKINDN